MWNTSIASQIEKKTTMRCQIWSSIKLRGHEVIVNAIKRLHGVYRARIKIFAAWTLALRQLNFSRHAILDAFLNISACRKRARRHYVRLELDTLYSIDEWSATKKTETDNYELDQNVDAGIRREWRFHTVPLKWSHSLLESCTIVKMTARCADKSKQTATVPHHLRSRDCRLNLTQFNRTLWT